ncbi:MULTISPECIES: helix-turn-helix domain-containing protein [Crocosphaera]|uniref:Molecular chaperone GrpE (Heat shock protein) n=2 Tax=Crocosphaera watsonii TaxID=263511 RepID=T2JUE3_CROWT|nr:MULTISPECIES: helix-turn-helix transcriptional regulator [Crocosphaera]MCH2246633.1 helix-turn-helix domain-containing protein [Crocosphaera sp.]NQZ61898.1 helix-turn-helix transcriptional regulator [Crocosphaera sp.]CCQ59376.1 COG0576: Molecular chaperone GrpE (heat shock protein) [Crocosphaera watsonii WH 0005]CCQ68656.1 Molecular chaperone GrpE (heat shock protein) [Crocosphaera watsonii WH 0402]
MNQSSTYVSNQQKLQQLMQQAEIANFEELSQVSGVSQWQLNRLLTGLLPKLSIIDILKLSKVLNISLEGLLLEFETAQPLREDWKITNQENFGDVNTDTESLQKEYKQLQQKLDQQQETSHKEFQSASIAALESWLLQWPTAAIIAKKNPEISAVKLLPLVRPIFELLKQWGLEMKGTVGEVIPYNPQFHQLLEGGGHAEVGEPVIIRYVGYDHDHKLLYRPKVSPVKKDEETTTTTN